MKKIYTFFAVLLSASSFGQITWNQQTGVGTTDLYGVSFPDVNHGWCVGLNGTVLVTSDGGNTWIQQSSPAGANLRCVFFLDANNGWACGDGGEMMHTTNGGGNWAVQTTSTLSNLRGVHFYDVNNGWTVGSGNVILHTTNGGATWTAQTSSSASNSILTAVQAVSSSAGYVASSNPTPNGFVMNTTNSGSTWNNQTSPSTYNLNAIDFRSSTTGWTCGTGGKIYKTTNSGSTWSNSYTGAGTHNYRGVSFADMNNGWVVGDSGYIYMTNNGGSSWTWQNTFMISTLRAVHFVDANDGWAVGDNGTILRMAFPGAVHENSMISLVNLFPNPSDGNSIIEISSVKNAKGKYTVTDLSGRTIVDEAIELQQGQNTITMHLPAYIDKGIYTVIIEAENGDRIVNRLNIQ